MNDSREESRIEIISQITSSLENRLLSQVDLSMNFKEAKKEFTKSYLHDILILNLGNISKAAKKANLNRRHFYRIINEFDVNPDVHRQEMIKPTEYLKSYIPEFQNPSETKKEDISTQFDDITEAIASEFMGSVAYEEALSAFEKEYIENALKEHDYNIHKTASAIDVSERTLYRKLSKLNIAVA